MKILDITQPELPKPLVNGAVHLDPWPFVADRVALNSARYIDVYGTLTAVVDGMDAASAFHLEPDFNVLVSLSDGTIAVTSLDGLAAYQGQT